MPHPVHTCRLRYIDKQPCFQFGLVFVVAAAAAAPQFVFDDQQQFVLNDQPQFVSSGRPDVRIVSQKNVREQTGNYEYTYEQSNGQKVKRSGSQIHSYALTLRKRGTSMPESKHYAMVVITYCEDLKENRLNS